MFLVHNRLLIGSLLLRIRNRGRREIGEQLIHRRDVASRLVLKLVGGMVSVAEQLRALGAQLHDLQHDLAVVELAAFAVPRK